MAPVEVTGPAEAGTVPGVATATATQRSYLELLLELVESARVALGLPFVWVTSWITGAHDTQVHSTGAALDFAGPDRATTAELWVWLGQHRLASVGELILEPPDTGATGHVHVTLPGFGGNGQFLYKTEGGEYLPVDPFSVGSSGLPPVVNLPGLVVTVGPSSSSSWLTVALALLGAFLLWKARGGAHNE